MTHPVPDNEDERLAALRRYGILETPAEPAFDDLALLAAASCEAPMALVSFMDADREWFKAKVGLPMVELPREGSFCAHAITQADVFVVADARADARFAGCTLLSGVRPIPPIRFYAGAPLVTADGYALGTVCVLDHVVRQLSPPQGTALRLLARQALNQLELRIVSERRRTLLEINNAIITTLELDRLLHATCRALQRAIPFDRAVLTIYRPEQDTLRIYALEGLHPREHFRVGTELPRKDSPVGWVFDRKRPLLRRDLEAEQQFAAERRLVSEGVRSLCIVPLVAGGRSIGTLNVGSFTRNQYTEAHAAFLQEAANQVALAVANAQAYEEIAALKVRLQAENVYLQEEIGAEHNFTDIIGKSPALLEALHKVESVAPTDSTVLILGETGTGKELFARAIHSRSARRERPLVKLNCGAIASGLVESELFGHVKGAFTGAIQHRTGRFELADRGTLFLDEVSELPLETQVKLLRVLQEQEFEPVGSSRTVRVNVRVVAASNRRLEDEVRAGRFRADLLYRINVFPLAVPLLRDRRGDIPLLAAFFISRFAKRLGKPLEGVNRRSLELLMEYSWPGNVRELENVLERAAILAHGPFIELDGDLGLAGPPAGAAARPAVARPLDEMQRGHIMSILERTGGVIEGPQGAATILGLHPNTLRSRMKKLGIRRDGIKP